jgi:hypothetical protein
MWVWAMTVGSCGRLAAEVLPSHCVASTATVTARAINKNATANSSSRTSRRRR